MCAKRRLPRGKSEAELLEELLQPDPKDSRYLAKFSETERRLLFALRRRLQIDPDKVSIQTVRERFEALIKRPLSYQSFRFFMRDDGSRYPDPYDPGTPNGRTKKRR